MRTFKLSQTRESRASRLIFGKLAATFELLIAFCVDLLPFYFVQLSKF